MSVLAPGTRPLHHVGYVVDDLEAAAQRLAETVGAGPFLHLGHVALEVATYRGAAAQYDHETAFGQWGAMIVEISRIEAADPPGLRDFFASRPAPAIGHLGWLVDDLEAESDRLQRAGLELVHTGGSGPVRAHWHDGGPLFGHPVEVLQRCPEILGLYAAIGDAAAGWDGRAPLRIAPVPSP